MPAGATGRPFAHRSTLAAAIVAIDAAASAHAQTQIVHTPGARPLHRHARGAPERRGEARRDQARLPGRAAHLPGRAARCMAR